MQVQVEKTGPCASKISVVVPAAQVNDTFEQVYRRVAKSARIPGFRAGKAPKSVIERHYNDHIITEVENKLVESTLFKALDEQKVSAVSMPRIEPGKLTRDADYAYSATVETHPEVKLAQYKGLPIAKIDAVISDEDVERELNRMRERQAQLVPVADRDTVEKGDVVGLDYKGSIDGTFFEGGSADGATIEAGGTEVLPQLSNGLIGLKVGAEADITVDFPADYGAAHLAGKASNFHVKINDLRKKEMPALDDAFAEDIGETSLQALKDKLTEQLRTTRNRDAERATRRNALQALVDANPFDLPHSMVAQHADRMVADTTARVQQMLGQRIQLSPQELAGLRESSTKDAEFQVRGGLLLLEVAKEAAVKIEDSEIDAEVERIAAQSGEQAEQARQYYARPDARENLRYRLTEDKTIALLLEQAAG